MRIEHILVATDLSPASEAGHAHAVALAKLMGARITLIHVDEPGALARLETPAAEDALERSGADRRRRLEAQRNALAEAGVDARAEVISGTPWRRILAFAAEYRADLLVVTKQGMRPIEPLLVGSTALRLVRAAALPTLVVTRPDRPAKYDTIVSTTDFSADSALGLSAALALTGDLHSKLVVAHVIRHPRLFVGGLGSEPVPVPDELFNALHTNAEARLAEAVAATGSTRVETRLLVGDSPARALVEADLGADMFVVPSHGTSSDDGALLGSTTERLLRLADVPLLVLPHRFLQQRAADATN